MRDLIELIESFSVLDESTGLANRKPGEKWQNAQGQTLTFNNVGFYPEGGGSYNTETLKQVVSQVPGAYWFNKMPARGGVGIATFTDEQGNEVYVGRFFQEIKPNKTDNKWKNSDIIPGFEYQSKASKKERSGLKPSDFLTDVKSQTPDSLLQQVVKHFGPDSDEARAVAAFMRSTASPIRVPRGNMQLESFRDYLGEILQPIALVRGMPVEGNAREAAQNFFGTPSYSDCVISFNEGVSGGLYDSLLVNSNNKQIKLSSKGESGAMASVVNFLRCIEELDATPIGRKLRTKHKDVIDIIDAIDQGGHFGGPLTLAEHYGIIDADDVLFVPLLKNFGPRDKIDWGKHKKLERLYNDREAKDLTTMVPAEHMIAAIAYKVADYVNDNTNFSAAASEILNTSALVQMYTFVKEKDAEFEITFKAEWPSTAVTGVKLSAGKTYMSTAKGGGNMVFKILRGGAKDVDDSEESGKKPSQAAKLDKQAQKAGTAHTVGADVVTRPGKKKSNDLGRERR